MISDAHSVSSLDVGAVKLHTVHEDNNTKTVDAFAENYNVPHDPQNITAEVWHSADELPRSRYSVAKEEKHTSPSLQPLLSTRQNSRIEFENIYDSYKQLFLQHGEELLRMRPVFCMQDQEAKEEEKKTNINTTYHSCFSKLYATEAAETGPCNSSTRQQGLRESLCEHEKKAADNEKKELTDFIGTVPHRQPQLLAAVRQMTTSLEASPARVSSTEQYNDLLQHHDKKLEEASASYARYAAELAKRFKRPPVIIPPHLMNNFADTNVIEAREHKGRMDITPQLIAQHKKQSRSERGVMSFTTATDLRPEEGDELQQERRPFGSFPLESDAAADRQQQQQQQQQYEQCGPRFTIHSLPNGDLYERDALSGQAYWECEAPAVQRRILPSQLLDESERKAFHMYRMYSRRWGLLLRELAVAIGGEEGADLLSRYEMREESMPLQYRCRRDFYESVVDYDRLLGEQERIMEKVERDLERFYASRADLYHNKNSSSLLPP